MRSATSFFNFTLLRKNFARFWPIWSLYGLFWLAVLPLNILSNRIHWDGGMARSLPLNYLDGGPSAAVTLTALFGLLCAMAVFSYLYQSRSVGMLHALPVKREGLFLTNYLSGLSFFALPLLEGESIIRLTSPLESRGYVDMTLQVLRDRGIRVEELPEGFQCPICRANRDKFVKL